MPFQLVFPDRIVVLSVDHELETNNEIRHSLSRKSIRRNNTVNRVFAPLVIFAFLLTLSAGCKKPDVQEEAQIPASPASQSSSPESASVAGTPVEAGASTQAGSRSGTVQETMDAGGYTYVLVDTGSEAIWAAAPQFAVAVGDEVTVPPGMPMTDYHSDTLERDFDVVYFVPAILAAGAGAQAAGDPTTMPTGHPSPTESTDAGAVDLTGVEKAEGGFTVAEVFSGKADLSGQKISIRGKVVKFSGGIMGKNWIHLQDGTDHEGSNDLTVTTAAMANKGDTVLVSGTLVTDKDFGAGYRYDVIIEDAEVTAE